MTMAAKQEYRRKNERDRQRNARVASEGRDIGALPRPADVARRRACVADFRLFCLTYFPWTFVLPFSPDHLKVIGKVEESVLRGGLFAMAMPRGSGKTTVCECASIWAMLNGHRRFVVPIGSDAGSAVQMLESIKVELETNDLLAEDYPEVCLPIQALEGIANRCAGQLYRTERTHIEWTADAVVLPTLRPEGWGKDAELQAFVRDDGLSLASGVVVKVAGITGRIRGLKHKTADGKSIRPELVIIDDPQTDESANSASQCATRERTLAGAILGLAGPGKKISGIMPCTVIRPGDMADNILNREKHPEWNGERTKLIYSFPAAADLWARYAELWADGMRAGRGIEDATAFYRGQPGRHGRGGGRRVGRAVPGRRAIGRPARNESEAGTGRRGVLRGVPERAVEGRRPGGGRPDRAGPDSGRTNGLPRGRLPLAANRLTAFIDVQGTLLYYVVAAWGDDFTGSVVDYGAWPKQNRAYYSLRDARPTLAEKTKVPGLEAQLRRGLELLTDELCERGWEREDGHHFHVERLLIDANWGASTEVVKEFCRRSSRSAVLTAGARPVLRGQSSVPLLDHRKKPGERMGAGAPWLIPLSGGRHLSRHVLYDTNWWKTFIFQRLAIPVGGKGGLSLFDPDALAGGHRLFADHLTAEYRVRVEAKARTVDEWKQRPERPDNHWLDGIVGCAVAASVQGVSLDDLPASRTQMQPRKVSWAARQREKRGGR
jgi:hypothetical protein